MKLEFPIYPSTYVCVVGSCVNTTSSQEDQFISFIMLLFLLLGASSVLPVGRFCPLQWRISPALFIGTHLLPSSLARISCSLQWHVSPALFIGMYLLILDIQSATENLTVIRYLFSSYGGCRCIQLIMHYYGNHSHNTG